MLTAHKGFVLDALGDHATVHRAAAESLAAMPETWPTSEGAAQRRALAQA